MSELYVLLLKFVKISNSWRSLCSSMSSTNQLVFYYFYLVKLVWLVKVVKYHIPLINTFSLFSCWHEGPMSARLCPLYNCKLILPINSLSYYTFWSVLSLNSICIYRFLSLFRITFIKSALEMFLSTYIDSFLQITDSKKMKYSNGWKQLLLFSW